MLDFSALYSDPLSVGSITDYFPSDGGAVTSSGPSSSSGGVDWGSAFVGGLNRWLDVEVWRATNGAGVPEWNKTAAAPGGSTGAGAARPAIGGNLTLLIGLGIGAFLLLRG